MDIELYNESHPITLVRKMYYDSYEKNYGDGFYPQLKDMPSGASINMAFRLIKYKERDFAWVQVSGCAIRDFDGLNGDELLISLNLEAQVDAKWIINWAGRIIYPKINASSTYRVLAQSRL